MPISNLNVIGMQIKIIRRAFSPLSTIGDMLIDGDFFCYTLEDVVRTGVKVFGNTAIPAGEYKLYITYSPRFKCDMPQIMDVPGFEGIRIHPGNTAKDTEGCILLGQNFKDDFIGQSRLAFNRFLPLVKSECASHGFIPISIL